jgi:hypothetical protein
MATNEWEVIGEEPDVLQPATQPTVAPQNVLQGAVQNDWEVLGEEDLTPDALLPGEALNLATAPDEQFGLDETQRSMASALTRAGADQIIDDVASREILAAPPPAPGRIEPTALTATRRFLPGGKQIAEPVDPDVDLRAMKRLPGNIGRSSKAQVKEAIAGTQRLFADLQANMDIAKAESYRSYQSDDPQVLAQQQAAAGEAEERAGHAELAQGRAARTTRRAQAEGQAAIPADAGEIERAIQSGVSSAAVTLPIVTLGSVVPGGQGAALVTLGGMTGSARYGELRAAGLDEGTAALSAAALGGLEGLTEKIPLGTLAKKSPFIEKATEFLVQDLLGENVSTVAQIADDYRLGLRDDVTMADVQQAIKETSAATIAGSAAQLTVSGIFEQALNRANQKAIDREAKAGMQRQEPFISEPDLAGIGELEYEAAPAAAAGDLEVVAEEPLAAAPGSAQDELAALEALRKGGATPEQEAILEGLGHLVRTETGTPVLLPSGRRRLTELNQQLADSRSETKNQALPQPVAAGAKEAPGSAQPGLGEAAGTTPSLTEATQGAARGVRVGRSPAPGGERQGESVAAGEANLEDTIPIPQQYERVILESIIKDDATPGQIGIAISRGFAKRRSDGTATLLPAGRRRLVELESGQPPADVEATFEGEELRRAGDLRRTPRVEVKPAQARSGSVQTPRGGFTVHVDGKPVVELPDAQAAREAAAGFAADGTFKTTVAGQPVSVDVTPTDAQKASGTYTKGHIRYEGLQISIENPKGSIRSGVSESGRKWSRALGADYGYVRGSESADGDHVDVFLGDATSDVAYIVDQVKADGTFDEHKVMLGYPSLEAATAAYRAQYPKGWKGLGAITHIPIADFKTWVKSPQAKQPYAWKPKAQAVAAVPSAEPAPERAKLHKKIYRGTEAGTKGAETRAAPRGELGPGIYFTPDAKLAASYGGGPTASIAKGTRVVHTAELARDLKAEEIGTLEGGSRDGETARLVSNGKELWRGEWNARKSQEANYQAMVKAIKGAGLKMIVGADDSIAINQVAVTDPNILKFDQAKLHKKRLPLEERADDASDQQRATLRDIDTASVTPQFQLRAATEDVYDTADAHFTSSEVLKGVHDVPLKTLGLTGYDDAKSVARIARLAEQIKESGEVSPIMVGIDRNGEAYVMEGQHRARALQLLGSDSIPAKIVLDTTDDDGVRLHKKQTETAAFKKWFGDSKVVDADGNPQVVYHGTGNLEGLNEFRPELTGLGNDQIGSGFYFTTSQEEASAYTTARMPNAGTKLGGDQSPGIVPAYLSIKNPIIVKGPNLRDVDVDLSAKQVEAIIRHAPRLFDVENTPLLDWHENASTRVTPAMVRDVAKKYTGPALIQIEHDFFGREGEATKFREALRKVLGYDGAVIDFGTKKHWVAWFPEQIKSAIGNRGTFNPKDPDIRFHNKQSKTDAFRRWFGESKIVDDEGNPLVVYHGTGSDFTEFQPTDYGWYGWGSYFTSNEKFANEFAEGADGNPNVMPVYLAIERPFYFTPKDNDTPTNVQLLMAVGHSRRKAESIINREGDVNVRVFDKLQEEGHDGIVVLEPGRTEYIIFEPSQIKSAIGNTGAFDPANPNILFHKAFHGSPYRFQKFVLDDKTIGTGEGAHAYGWGLYFAENEAVAKDYQRRLSDSSAHVRLSVNGKELEDGPERHGASLVAFNDLREVRALAKRWLAEYENDPGMKETAEHAGLAAAEYWPRLNSFVQSHTKRDIKVARGLLYSVEINDAAVKNMLDWDVTWESQLDTVKETLRKAGVFKRYKANLSNYGTPMQTRNRKMRGESIYAFLSMEKGGDQAASKYLSSLGIHGLRYKDEGSRGKRGGTRNIVVFDDSIITVTHIDGSPVTAQERTDAIGPLFSRVNTNANESRYRAITGTPREQRSAQVRTEVNRVLRNFPGASANVVQTFNELPNDVRARVIAAGGLDEKGNPAVDAFYDPPTGQVYFIANEIESIDSIESLFLHEYVAHKGLVGMLDTAKRDEILNGIARDLPDLVRQKAADYGYRFHVPAERRVAAEEVVAEMAETFLRGRDLPAKQKGILDRIIQAIADVLRRIGLRKYDEQFIASLLTDLHRYAREGHARKETAEPYRARASTAPAFPDWDDSNASEVVPNFQDYVDRARLHLSGKSEEEIYSYALKQFDERQQLWQWEGFFEGGHVLVRGTQAGGYDLYVNDALIVPDDGGNYPNLQLAQAAARVLVAEEGGVSDAEAERILNAVPLSADLRVKFHRKPFFSQLAVRLSELRLQKAPASQWRGVIANLTGKGVSPEEIEWLGINEWLAEQDGKVTKEQVLQYVRANQVQIQEVVKSAFTKETIDEAVTAIDRALGTFTDWITPGDLDYYDRVEPSVDKDKFTTYARTAKGERIDMTVKVTDVDSQDWNDGGWVNATVTLADGRSAEAGAWFSYRRGTLEIDPYGLGEWRGDEFSEDEVDAIKEAIGEIALSENTELMDTVQHASDEFDSDLIRARNELLSGDVEAAISALKDAARTERVYGDDVTVSPIVDLLTEDEGSIKYEDWKLPGGENYRELLLTLPPKKDLPEEFKAVEIGEGRWAVFGPGPQGANRYGSGTTREEAIESFVGHGHTGAFISKHWAEPNILAHVRFDERTDADGKRVLFIEEIQSDWHQAGRKHGYKGDYVPPSTADIERYNELRAKRDITNTEDAELTKLEKLIRQHDDMIARLVPDAPFKTSWPELAFKRILKWAVDENFDRVTWTTGAQQADRYDLSKKVKAIEYTASGRLIAMGISGSPVMNEAVPEEKIADYVGEELAKKLLEQPLVKAGPVHSRVLRDVDLKMGGEGMVEFYDQMLPRIAVKLTKKWGGRASKTKLRGVTREERINDRYQIRETSAGWTLLDAAGNPLADRRAFRNGAAAEKWLEENGYLDEEVHSLDITDDIREVALGGLPMFHRKSMVGVFRRRQAVQNGTFDLVEGSRTSRWWNLLVFKAQDRFYDLFRLNEQAKIFRQIAQLPDSMDAYLKETLYHGRVEDRVKEYEKQFVEPLVKMIKDSGYTWQQVEDYLYARHAPEANARLLTINNGNPNFHSGMTDAEATQVMTALGAAGNIANLQAIGAHVDAMTQWERSTLVLEGLEDQATITEWENTYDHYVPLKGWAHNPELAEMPRRGRGFDTGGRTTKDRTGRTSRAGNILANIVAQAQMAVIRAEKAKVGRALLEFVKANPAPRLYEVNQVEYHRYIDSGTGLVRQGVNPQYKLADNVVRVRMAGKDEHIVFNPNEPQMQRLATAMKNLSATEMGLILSFLHGINRYLSTINTSLNPEFVISNALRDLQTAGINLQSTDLKGQALAIMSQWRHAWKAIRQAEAGNTTHAWAPWWDRFKKAGAKTGWIQHYGTPVDIEKKLQKEINRHGVVGNAAKGIEVTLGWIERQNLAVENAMRLAAFRAAVEAGMSDERAAQIAKNLTVNFNKRGDLGIALNSFILFYNAGVQGTATILRAAKSPRARKFMYGLVAAGIVIDIINRMVAGEDDDDENRYDKIRSYEKERNIIVMLPKEQRFTLPSGDEIDHLKIPMPYGYNFLYYTGTKIGGVLDYHTIGNKRRFEPAEDAAQVVASFLGAFNPIGGFANPLESITAVEQYIQLKEERAWDGRPLMPPQPQYDIPVPDSQRFWRSTGKGAREVTAWLNEHTGGTDVTPGKIDISPATVDYWIDFALGGSGRFISNTINATHDIALDRKDLDLGEVPFVRRVLGQTGERDRQERFYTRMNEVQYVIKEREVAREMRRFAKTPEEMQPYEERNAFIDKRYPIAAKVEMEGRRAEAKLKQLRAGRKALQKQEGRMEESKRLERIESIEAEMRATMDQFNRSWNEAEDAQRGATETKDLIGQLGPIIDGKNRRDAVRALREAGKPATAELLAALPTTLRTQLRELLEQEAAS